MQKQVEQSAALAERFKADEKSIKPETLAARAVPDWLREEMDLPVGYLRQLQREPALWLRARPGSAARLAHELGNCETTAPITQTSVPKTQNSEPKTPTSGTTSGTPAQSADRETPNSKPHTPNSSATGATDAAGAPDALRYTGTQDLFLTPAFHRGAFEIQDLASQLVGHACQPKPGETWWDACAGEGGKLLHLADLMANKGVVWATDRSERRLQVLKRRASRAQLFNFRTALWDGSAKLPTKTKFDGILVDAPCSGVGTWQRNPHARWTITPDDVRELAATQRALLEHVAGSLKPRGRLVYAVCTLTRSETTAVADAFTAAHPEFKPLPLFDSASPQAMLWPQELNANGMFIAAWKKEG